MKIYTRTGDEGSTRQPDGRDVAKCDPQIEALGALDELNSHIGWALAAAGDERHAEIRDALELIQSELLTAGVLLTAAGGAHSPAKGKLPKSAVTRMEQQIDAIMPRLPELKHFIIPGGCELAARLHITRTISRLTERSVARAATGQGKVPKIVFKYLNRLSDLLFALGRSANHAEGIKERIWDPGKTR